MQNLPKIAQAEEIDHHPVVASAALTPALHKF
jgi:hypothetical protein